MSELPGHLVEVGASFAPTYQSVLDFSGWRVAMLRHFDVVAGEHFFRVERHRNTNEVFILTAGQAMLILCEGDAQPEKPYIIPLETNVAYNVKQWAWHHVILSTTAHIILFERSETGPETTDYAELSPALIQDIKAQFTF